MALTASLDDLCSIPGIHMVEGENQLFPGVPRPLHACVGVHHIQTKNVNKLVWKN